MSILSTNKKLISIGAEYSAGQGIDITDHIISVVESAVGEHYSAGPNIDIYDVEGQPTISSKDWTNDIEQASANAYEQAIAQIPEPQDLSYISAKVDTNTSGIDYISSVCLTAHQDWTDTIKGASSYSYEQSTSYFDNWISGQYTGDITNITNKITALSGDLGDYYKKTETSSKNEINDALQYVSANAGGTDYYETAVTSTQDFVVQQPGVVQSGNGNVRYSKLVSNIYGTNNIEATALGLENLNNAKIYANFSNVTSYGFSYPSIYLSGTLNGSDTYGGWQFSNTSTYTSTLANGIDITAISSRGDVNLVGLGIPDTILGVYFLANANNSTITAKTVPFTASITSPGTTISLTSLYDSIPETSGFVPLSSFNELKQSYDALSSLFATYSGQWLLPNEGV